MARWPDGKSIAFGLIIPWEVWPSDIGTPKSHQRAAQRPVPSDALYPRDMWAVFDHEYAEAQGLRRILSMFADYNVRTSFVANGKRVELNPDLAREAAAAGHDMGSENYEHAYPIMMSLEEERASLEHTVSAFKSILGSAPTGYISPGHRPTPNTVPLVFDLGYSWHADFQGDDVPFRMQDGDRDLVCMPYAHVSDYQSYSAGGRTPRDLLQMAIDEFDVLRKEGLRGSPKMMGFAIHPFICHGFRTRILELMLDHILACPDVWVATRSEIADWVRQNPKDFATVTKDQVLSMFPAT
ncbi:MAG: hypothetical protein EPN30_00905 [Actinomycetota bacterium]|nr:MAG: hypothetical protein EPN30_00905 [Actinomycetota bacterium]